MKIKIVTTLAAVLTLSGLYFFKVQKKPFQSTINIPQGWSEYKKKSEEICFQQTETDGLHVSADLDADNISDEAYILKNQENQTFGLFVYLSTAKKFLLVKDLGSDLGQVSLELISPGEVKTACGKGYWDCKADEPELLKLTYPALNVVYCEKSDFALIWKTESQSFSEVWLSD